MWGSIIGAGIGAVSSLAGGLINSAGAADRNAMSWQQMQAQQAFSAAQAQREMDFQERMSNTQYQRGMADMKAAGLNPILAYSQGGASSPGGAMGSAGSAQFENAMEGAGQGVSSAGNFARNLADLQQVKANTASQVTTADLNTANTELAKVSAVARAQDTATSAADEKRKLAETALTIEQMENPKAARALMGAQSHSARASGDLSDEQRKQLVDYGPHWIGQAIGSADRVWNRVRGALQRSDVPPGLPAWLSSDNPVVQQRIHNRRGVTVQASPPRGLTIDMRR